VGYCPVESVHAHYRDASIFCLPVHREPFGVAFVEAMHHALPIVGTRVGAVRDLVQEDVNGFLVDVGDVDTLAARLDRLLSDAELRAKMGDRSKQLARSGYTWPRVAEKMANTIWETLCRGADHRRVLLIGLDAADKDLLTTRWTAASCRACAICAARAPGGGRLAAGFGSGAIWPSFSTGVSPAKHGRYFYRQVGPGATRRSASRRARSARSRSGSR
jgi:hypothetical protein